MGFINCNNLLGSDEPAINAMLLSYEAEVRQTALSRAVRNLLEKEISASDEIVKAKFVEFVELVQLGATTNIENQVFGLTREETQKRSALFDAKKRELLEGTPPGSGEAIDQQIMTALQKALQAADQLILDADKLVSEVEKELLQPFKKYVAKDKTDQEREQIYNSQTHNKDYIRSFDRWVLEARGEAFAPGFTSQPEGDKDEPLGPKVGFRD